MLQLLGMLYTCGEGQILYGGTQTPSLTLLHPSSKLCHDWLRCSRSTLYNMVTALKRHSISPHICLLKLPPSSRLCHDWLHRWRSTPYMVTPLKGHSICLLKLPPSSKPCHDWLHHWRSTLYMVTPLKGHSFLNTFVYWNCPPPPNSAMIGYTIEGALCIWLYHWLIEGALRISTHLSTEIAPFFQTLPWLVTLVKDHSVYDYTIGGALCIWLHHWRGTSVSTHLSTEIAPFLQTLPWLVTPSYRVMLLKGHSVSPHICLLKLPLVSTLHNFFKMFE